jgi:hypothetical protein
MTKSDRPTLGLDVEYQIETAQNQIHTNYWPRLVQMQVSTPEHAQSLSSLYPIFKLQPPTPKTPMALRRVLAQYASSLFETEATFYPNDPQLAHWLRQLADRITAKMLQTVVKLEETGRNGSVSLSHHGLTQSDMRAAISAALVTASEEEAKKRLMAAAMGQVKAHIAHATDSQAARGGKNTRLPATIECPAAARKLEAYLKSEGIGLTEFATKAGITDRTLRSFRRTGKIRRSIFADIAKAMGTTKESLLKS